MSDSSFEFGHNQPPDISQETGPCMGRVKCIRCSRFYGYCSEVEAQLTGINDDPGREYHGDNNDMISRPNNQPSNSGRNTGTRRKGSGLRYLSAEMLSGTHQSATIVDARVQADNFKPEQEVVVVKMKFKGEQILWTLRSNNPNLDGLIDAMGDDETKWSGHEIELYLEEDTFDGKKWIRSEVAPQPRATKATAKK